MAIHDGFRWGMISSLAVMHIVPALALYYYPINWSGFKYMMLMWAWSGLGITVAYHRLWSHGTYKARLPWRLFWGLGGTAAMEGSIIWWCNLHHLHHNFPDTVMDPYGPNHGFWYSHIGWLFYKTDRTEDLKRIDTSDLKRSKLVMLQEKYFLPLCLFFAFGIPVIFAEETWQALFYGGFLARIVCWHSTWCVNSLAHWLGENEYSIEVSAKDHFLTALATFGEGNHGFHHAFPVSYKNGVRWHDYDPTKLVIELGYYLGMCYDLKVIPENEINKARFEVLQKKLNDFDKIITWPDPSQKERKITIKQYQDVASKGSGKLWVTMNGFVYDISEFVGEHPGGDRLLRSMAGKSAQYIQEQFNYRTMHSKAARNLLDTMLIGQLVE